jgi:hypothetical protein
MGHFSRNGHLQLHIPYVNLIFKIQNPKGCNLIHHWMLSASPPLCALRLQSWQRHVIGHANTTTINIRVRSGTSIP